jgi:uncharacterized cupredoxin-like copper-binding protein
MWRSSNAALLAALALGACGSSHVAATSSSSAPSSSSATAAAGRCPALTTAYVGTQGATGHLEVTFSVRNVSKRPCDVGGYPAARLLDAAGRTLPMTIQRGHGFFPDTLRAPRSVTLAPGARARFGLSFVTNNEYAGAHRCHTVARAEAGMPGRSAARWMPVSLRGAPRLMPCGTKLVVSPVYA